MALSDEQIKIIAGHPLNDLLAQFPTKLRSLKESNESWRPDVASFLSILVDSTAAYNLPSSDGSGTVADKLFTIRQKVRLGGPLSFSHFRPLVDAVVAKSSDTDIWTAAINLIEALNPSTPPASTQVPTNIATPLRSSSACIADSETSKTIEQELFYEIRDCIHRDVPGFFEKHFNPATWDKNQKSMLQRLLKHHHNGKWTDFPDQPWEKPVWKWLTGLEKDAMAGAPYKLYSVRTATEFAERKGQMDLLFRKSHAKNKDYRDVLVVGEHKKTHNTGEFKALIQQLSRHVRGIFADQPLRRFVHAFTICDSIMELWIYDRSGLYSSGEFDIHENPENLARALVAYATMNNDAMGLDTFVEQKNNRRYVVAKDAAGKEKRVEVAKKKLLVRQRAIVCRGTTCYSTAEGVAKFSWRSADRQPSEVKHLTLAAARGVEGVARVVGHCEVASIADLRSGLNFSDRTWHEFRPTTDKEAGSSTNFKGLDSSESSRKRKSSEEDLTRSTRQRSSSRKSTLRQTHDGSDDGSDKGLRPSLYTPNREALYENRILSCLVISPAGRVVSDFESVKELLEVLRDAIRAHQSLLVKGRILHRDISSNNIIITDTNRQGAFKGMLIDLDLAKDQDRERSGARNQTGTMQFMAIQVLRGKDHTYRHDLESFFYVLLWMCARESWGKAKLYVGETPPKTSRLRKWEIGSFEEIADAKRGHMTVDGLEDIMDEFPSGFEMVKPLCLKIRKLLFPLDSDERMMIGTPSGDPAKLYGGILTAYDEAIDQL
ncbi:serine/threonine-protein kinase Sgk2 [Metarhizium rileyi]|uniref:EKC/KEOPS complex subunit BUD32 n=1 Tax=Metarhizium rileyi (strain RCEF 4871) TaxID=1649241 RepID=A0A167DAQ9_METRR|nr:serine/threonine-protein kinase Sgk2 [Metarhizium rileyi RCEF 4871]